MSFGRDVKRFTVKTGQSLDRVHRGVVLELFSSVVKDTPVDTGRARSNWLPSARVGRSETVEPTSIAATMGEIQSVAAASKAGDSTVLTNNLPYIGMLEYGHSKQAPDGMVRKNIARVQGILRRLAGGR